MVGCLLLHLTHGLVSLPSGECAQAPLTRVSCPHSCAPPPPCRQETTTLRLSRRNTMTRAEALHRRSAWFPFFILRKHTRRSVPSPLCLRGGVEGSEKRNPSRTAPCRAGPRCRLPPPALPRLLPDKELLFLGGQDGRQACQTQSRASEAHGRPGTTRASGKRLFRPPCRAGSFQVFG